MKPASPEKPAYPEHPTKPASPEQPVKPAYPEHPTKPAAEYGRLAPLANTCENDEEWLIPGGAAVRRGVGAARSPA
ncbi:hypothetical protein [Streptomyces sp. NRRL S-646]|uniref:hypothetical protein n=1 Tax=Streptomyces sp. NRRL S-646 TaxID=1463917 RepID=UPI0004C5E543|nr:hypothetical protein [Streptomyces sp. NRRL S-646]